MSPAAVTETCAYSVKSLGSAEETAMNDFQTIVVILLAAILFVLLVGAVRR